MSIKSIAAAAAAACSLYPFCASAVWINEIHYDNGGADTGEFVEIAGRSGTDLGGWSLAFYNGGDGAAYRTEPLAGMLPDAAGPGFGFLAFGISGIQNGGPDGLALLDADDAVVQFLSYEGQFTATDGAVAGLLSSDIGVAEDSATAAGFSLQLVGSGSAYADFAWTGPATASRGAVNAGQRISALSAPTGDGQLSAPPALALVAAGLGLIAVLRRRRFAA